MDNFQKISDILNKKDGVKPPAYPWQELALTVIKELNIPKFKRNAVFKVCREHHKALIERCLIDTKELCQIGEKWRYFFKLINQIPNNKDTN